MDEKIGQVAIWIILGIVLVASIILFFVIVNNESFVGPSDSDSALDVESFMKTCSEDSVQEAVNIMLPQGGLISPKIFATFDGVNIEYTCLNNGQFSPCIHQHPLLVNEMKNEIDAYATPKIESCFIEMMEEFERRNSQVQMSNNFDVKVGMKTDAVVLEIERQITVEKQGEKRNIEKIEFEITNPVYNLALIAMEIADQEANYCYFEYLGYSNLYPRYQIEKFTMSDSTGIYKIRDNESGKEMSIAIKSCVIRAGGG